MSFKYLRLALDTDLPRRERLILIELADCPRGQSDLAWPGMDRLRAKTKYDESQVRRALANLIKWGYIEVAEPSKRGRTVRYRLLMRRNEGALCLPNETNEGALCLNEGALCLPPIMSARAVLTDQRISKEDIREEEEVNACGSPAFDTGSEIPRETEPAQDEESHTHEPPVAMSLTPYQERREIIAKLIATIVTLSSIRYPVSLMVENLIFTCLETYGPEATLAYPEWVASPISGLPFWKDGRRTEAWEGVTSPMSLFKLDHVNRRLPRVIHWLETGSPNAAPDGKQDEFDRLSDAAEARVMARAQKRSAMDADFYTMGDDDGTERDENVQPHVQPFRQILPPGSQPDARNGHRAS